MKVLLVKICRIQSLDLLFLAVFISFYIRRFHLSQNFRKNIIWKKDFRHKFSFFNGFTHIPTPHPLNSQNRLSVTKVFCQCSLFHMKITESVKKSSHEDRGPCYLHSPIFFLIHTLSSSAAVVITAFLSKLNHRPLFSYIYYETTLQRIGFNIINKPHTLLPITPC